MAPVKSGAVANDPRAVSADNANLTVAKFRASNYLYEVLDTEAAVQLATAGDDSDGEPLDLGDEDSMVQEAAVASKAAQPRRSARVAKKQDKLKETWVAQEVIEVEISRTSTPGF